MTIPKVTLHDEMIDVVTADTQVTVASLLSEIRNCSACT